MNYIAQLNRFWQLRREVTFSSTEADLYFYLLEISNGLNWKNPFQQSNKLIEATLDVSEKTLIAARNRLKQHGLIDFTPGVKRSPTSYRLAEAPANTLEKFQPIAPGAEYTGKIPAHPGAIGEESGGQSGGNTPDIIKHKLNKEEKAASAAPSSLSSETVASSPNFSDQLEKAPAKGKSPAKPPARLKKPRADADEVAALPLPHPGADFAQRWATFRAGPKQAKKPLSAFELMLSKLGKYPEGFALVMLEAAIQGDWSGVENAGTPRAYAEWQAEQARRPATTPPPRRAPAAAEPDPVLNYDFLAEQAAREAAELARQPAAWQDAHAAAA